MEQRLASDPGLASLAAAVVDNASGYEANTARTWFPQAHRKERRFEVAYFAAEFALTDSLPAYAGGLGAMAGEFLKSASALGVPLVGVGLLYRETSHQWLDDSGLQQESWEVLDFERLPIELARDVMGRPVRVKVPLPGRDVVAQVWTVLVGRNRLYLLDTDIKPNRRTDRHITARLYGGDQETRIQQELLLGIGGVRALSALGHEPEIAHLNEGHSAFVRAGAHSPTDVPRQGSRSPRLAWRPHPGCCSRHTPRSPPGMTTFRPNWPIGTSRHTPYCSESTSRRSARWAATGLTTRLTRSALLSWHYACRAPATA